MVMSFNSLTVIFVPLAKTVPKSFVLFERFRLPTATKLAVPATVRLPAPDSAIKPAVTSVRFPKVMASVIAILPVVLLPMVTKLAVISPISAEVRPRLAELSAPPRFTPAPSVWISTLPAVVASTVPVRFTLLAFRVIRPPLE